MDGGSPSRVLIIDALRATGLRGKGWARLREQLNGFFVHTNHRAFRIIGPFVHLQHVFHAGHELRILFRRDHPLRLQMGLEFVFFKSDVPFASKSNRGRATPPTDPPAAVASSERLPREGNCNRSRSSGLPGLHPVSGPARDGFAACAPAPISLPLPPSDGARGAPCSR